MYRRPKFLEELHEIRGRMSREANFDVEIFAEMIQMSNSLPPTPRKNQRMKARRGKTAAVKKGRRAKLPEQEVGK
jgi:hypothetical protein